MIHAGIYRLRLVPLLIVVVWVGVGTGRVVLHCHAVAQHCTPTCMMQHKLSIVLDGRAGQILLDEAPPGQSM